MKISRSSSVRDVALAVGDALRRLGVAAVLTGGACATIHSDGEYVSADLDFVLQTRTRQADLDAALAELGFRRERDRYVHRSSPFWIEFPRGPLAIGADTHIKPIEIRGRRGVTLALSPTDACRDRLAAFYHWNDRQSLHVAILIAAHHRLNLGVIRRWSEAEGHLERYGEFRRELRSLVTRSARKAGR